MMADLTKAALSANSYEISLKSTTAVVRGDFDPRGNKGEAFDPRMQALRVHCPNRGG
jgi:hypothetical protein